MSPTDIAVLFTPDAVKPPAEFKVVLADTGEQMIGTPVETPANGVDIVTLGVDDVPAMIELTALTKPGPFSARTHELGTFLGIRVDGQLVAMAGERMKPAHYTEMTAVCVHPSHRGRGYGQMLLSRRFTPDRVARRNSLPACLHQQSLGDCALPAAGDGNPAPSPCDGVEERGLIAQRCAPRPIPSSRVAGAVRPPIRPGILAGGRLGQPVDIMDPTLGMARLVSGAGKPAMGHAQQRAAIMLDQVDLDQA